MFVRAIFIGKDLLKVEEKYEVTNCFTSERDISLLFCEIWIVWWDSKAELHDRELEANRR